MKIDELIGRELDQWVARADGYDPARYIVPEYSTDWSEAGPIIERENIQITPPTSRVHRLGGPLSGWNASGIWTATTWHAGVNGKRSYAYHETSPLVAAMRCYVMSKFGSEVSADSATERKS